MNRIQRKKWIILLMTLVLTLTLCSCGGNKDSSSQEGSSSSSQSQSEVVKVADSFLKAIQEDDTDTIAKLYEGGSVNLAIAFEDSADDGGSALMDSMENKLTDFSYELGKEKEEGDTATVEVAVTTYPFGDALKKYYDDYLDQVVDLIDSGASDQKIGELSQSLLTKRLDEMKKNYKGKFTMNLTKKDGEWKVDEFSSDSDFYDVMTGGMADALDAMAG